METRMMITGLVGLAWLAASQAAPARAAEGDLGKARSVVQESASESLAALNRAQTHVTDPEGISALTRARQEIVRSRDEALEDLDEAQASGNAQDGLTTAFEATKKHEAVLLRVMDEVPDVAKGAIQRALDASMQGNRTVGALRDGATGPQLKPAVDGTRLPAPVQPRSPAPRMRR
jgi:hypothetical protein